MKTSKLIKRLMSTIIVMILIIGILQQSTSFAQNNGIDSNTADLSVTNNKYLEYNQKYQDKKEASQKIEINPLEYQAAEGVLMQTIENINALVTSDTSSVTYHFTVLETARYALRFTYYPVSGKGTKIEREVLIDGKSPFDETRSIQLTRFFENLNPYVKTDQQGNEYFVGMEEAPKWTDYYAKDSYGYYNEPFQFYLEAGNHTVTINSVKEPLALSNISFESVAKLQAYSEYQEGLKAKGAKEVNAEPVIIEAENTKAVSDNVLYPTFDRSSPATTPSSSWKIRLNIISGNQWQQAGQWLKWEVDVKEDGFYKVSLRVKQDFNDGMFTARKLFIDDKVPFAEAENITFQYNTKWKIITLGEKEPYHFYLTKGKHTLCLQNTLGTMSEVIVNVDDILKQLNACYTSIMTITGPTPDTYRDYKLEKLIPDTIKKLGQQADRLDGMLKKIRSVSGVKGSYLSPLERVMIECRQMSDDPSKIARLFGNFENDIGSLATWLTTSQQQPLTIDKLYVSSPQEKLPGADAGIFSQIKHQFFVFLSSYFNDINQFDKDNQSASIKVWLGSCIAAGRDQAMIVKRMIDDTFTPETNISVDFKLVSAGTLLPSYLSGNSPDVALRVGATDAMNFALRGTVVNVSHFSDFEEVTKRFHESAMIPLTFQNVCYGLPETQSFPVMFYRKDILSSLNLEPPETWDDVYSMLPTLQRNNMNFSIPVTNFSTNEAFAMSGNQTKGFKSYAMLLFQRDGVLYREDGKYSALDGKVQTEAFKQWTELFKDYRLPLSFSFETRFASGEIPVGIEDYLVYNNLMIYFPEIRGLWGFKEVPGTVGEDGKINHSVPSDISCSLIMKNTKNEKAAWEFIKFWTDAKAQTRFGRELEALQGPSGRWPSANLEAFKQTPWKTSDLNSLISQFRYVKGVPEVPGGYYTTRYLDLAFRRVVFYKDNPKDTLFNNTRIINDELTAKRQEFGFN